MVKDNDFKLVKKKDLGNASIFTVTNPSGNSINVFALNEPLTKLGEQLSIENTTGSPKASKHF